LVHFDFENLGLADRFPFIAAEDVDVDGGDIVARVVPVDGAPGFCGEGDVLRF
jgi:hypothetical protein